MFRLRRRGEILRWVFGCAGMLLFALLIFFAVRTAAAGALREEAHVLEQNLHRAAVQCYAVEGFYPPDAGYLEENYGVAVNRDRYAVHYEVFASNILPEITVVLR